MARVNNVSIAHAPVWSHFQDGMGKPELQNYKPPNLQSVHYSSKPQPGIVENKHESLHAGNEGSEPYLMTSKHASNA